MIHEQFRAYLDDVDIINAELPFYFYVNNNEKFYLDGELLSIVKIEQEDGIYYFTLRSIKTIINFKVIHELVYCGLVAPLVARGIVKTDIFNRTYKTDDELGVQIIGTDKNISYRISLYAPTATKVSVEYFPVPNTQDYLELLDKAKSQGIILSSNLKVNDQGVWHLELPYSKGKEDFYYYQFNVGFPTRSYYTNDPYALYTDEHGNAFFSAKPKVDKPTSFRNSLPITEAVIYEISLRDVTSRLKSLTGSFEDFLKDDTLLDHIKRLGVTHVQIQPVNDFFGVFKSKTNNIIGYNWGYNPMSWFSLEDTFVRTNEVGKPEELFKKIVDKLHDNGIGVILDVVYNHIWDIKTSPLNLTVPYYHFRYDEYFKPTRLSGCGNDISSEMPMTRKLLVKAVSHMIKTYDLDGLRFDIMGLLDVDTMNEISLLTKNLGKQIYLYGEGWVYNSPIDKEKRANMLNNRAMTVGHFNDNFRDSIFSYCLNRSVNEFPSLRYLSNMFDSTTKSINYLACHDGRTLFDKINIAHTYDIVSTTKLLFGLLILCPGVVFLHGGDEFLRTKQDQENSYRSGDDINGFDYDLISENKIIVNYVSKLIALRKEYKVFSSTTTEFKLIEHLDSYYYYEKFENSSYFVLVKRNINELTIPKHWKMIFNNGSSQLNASKIINEGVYVFQEQINE